MSAEFAPRVKIFVAGAEKKEILSLLSAVFGKKFERHCLETERFSAEF